MSQEENDKKEISNDILNELDENFPTGPDFAKIIEYYFNHFDALSLY